MNRFNAPPPSPSLLEALPPDLLRALTSKRILLSVSYLAAECVVIKAQQWTDGQRVGDPLLHWINPPPLHGSSISQQLMDLCTALRTFADNAPQPTEPTPQ